MTKNIQVKRLSSASIIVYRKLLELFERSNLEKITSTNYFDKKMPVGNHFGHHGTSRHNDTTPHVTASNEMATQYNTIHHCCTAEQVVIHYAFVRFTTLRHITQHAFFQHASSHVTFKCHFLQFSLKTDDTDQLVVERQDDVSTSLHPVTYFRLAWCKDETKNNCPSRHDTSCLFRRNRVPNVPINSGGPWESLAFLFFSLSFSSHPSHLPHLSHLAYPPAHLLFDLVSHPITHFVFHFSSPTSFFISSPLSSFIPSLSCVSSSVCVHLHVGLLTVCRYETQTSTLQHGITRHSTATQLSSARTDMM